MPKPVAPLLADIALDRRDLDGVAHKVRRGDAVWHDVVCDGLHRVERAELAAIGPVAPGGVVFAIEVELHRERCEQAAEQEQNVRHGGPELKPI